MQKNIMTYDPRQELKTGSFELQHKRDTGLEQVALHHHDFYEIYYLISGDVTYQIEGKVQHVSPGDLLLISPQELHQVSISAKKKPYERLVLWLLPSEIQRLSTPDCDLEIGLDSNQPLYKNLLHPDQKLSQVIRWNMDTIYQEAESGQFGSPILLESCLHQLLVMIRRLQESASDSESAYAADEMGLTSEVLSYISAHYADRITLDTLAEHFYISKYHLCHEFQRHIGTGIYRYLQKKRLQMAKQMLRSGASASETSVAVGFGDYASFYRAFVAEYGITPRDFVHSWNE